MEAVATTGAAGVAGYDVSTPAAAESSFQSLFDQGAFEPDGKPQLDNAATEGQQAEVPTPGAEEGDAAEGQDQAPQYKDFNEFLKAVNAAPEIVDSLPVTVKVDGQERQVPLKDVLKSYQLDAYNTQRSQAVVAEKQALEQERVAARTLIGQELRNGRELGLMALNMLNQDFQRIDWNALRATQPAEFAALQVDFQHRQQAIAQHLNQVQMREQELAKQDQARVQQTLRTEHERMMAAVPEWRDPAKFKQDTDNLRQFCRTLGYTDAELSSVGDHRFMLLARQAASHAALQASTPAAVKRVREAPPMGKPGARTTAAPADQQRKAVLDRFSKNPRDADAALAAFDILAG